MSDQFYQVVTLTLGDGRKISYTGRYELKDTDRVISIECSVPHKMPFGMVWDRMVNSEDKGKGNDTK